LFARTRTGRGIFLIIFNNTIAHRGAHRPVVRCDEVPTNAASAGFRLRLRNDPERLGIDDADTLPESVSRDARRTRHASADGDYNNDAPRRCAPRRGKQE
jgi:hypothetical protein